MQKGDGVSPSPFAVTRVPDRREAFGGPCGRASHARIRAMGGRLVLVGDASEAPEMLGVKSDLDALACLLLQSCKHPLARLPEDLDPDRCVKRLGIGLPVLSWQQ